MIVSPFVVPSLVWKRVPLAGSVVILYVSESPSTSVPAKVIFLSVSSSALTVWEVAAATSLTALMVTVKDVSTVNPLEVPVSVIATMPLWLSW